MVNRGACYAFTQRYAQARQRYDQARQVRLDVEEIYDQYDWTGQGLVALAEKRYDQAIACFDKAIAINASYDREWYGKGKALQTSAGRFDRALGYKE
jgi:tetratricopeptide (TPR) repeat protein